MTDGPPKPYRVFIYSHPRTISNLLIKILETHPSIISKQYPFLHAFTYGPEMQRIRVHDEAAETIAKEDKWSVFTYQAGVDKIQTLAAEAEQQASARFTKVRIYI